MAVVTGALYRASKPDPPTASPLLPDVTGDGKGLDTTKWAWPGSISFAVGAGGATQGGSTSVLGAQAGTYYASASDLDSAITSSASEAIEATPWDQWSPDLLAGATFDKATTAATNGAPTSVAIEYNQKAAWSARMVVDQVYKGSHSTDATPITVTAKYFSWPAVTSHNAWNKGGVMYIAASAFANLGALYAEEMVRPSYAVQHGPPIKLCCSNGNLVVEYQT